jgi:dynactin complex subunit
MKYKFEISMNVKVPIGGTVFCTVIQCFIDTKPGSLFLQQILQHIEMDEVKSFTSTMNALHDCNNLSGILLKKKTGIGVQHNI